jgi:SAM-dependent methyltransferase
VTDSTKRFSDRVENYVKYRPGYPDEVYKYLLASGAVKTGDTIADLGSGTGISSQLFLRPGHRVYGVEPNAEMRAAAERLLSKDANFVSLAGSAEQIPLPDGSVELSVAGQAFHWFEPKATRAEMVRILKPGGQAALIWNMRDIEGSSFQKAYEDLLLEFGTDFKQVDHQRNLTEDKLAAFFAPAAMQKASFANQQRFDYAGLRGRLLSSSYAPKEGSAGYAPLMAALGALFERFAVDDKVAFVYRTEVYHGALSS